MASEPHAENTEPAERILISYLGHFVYDACLKRRTFYAITNRRVLTLQEGWTRKTIAVYLERIPAIESEGTTVGTIWFGPKYSVIGWQRSEDPQLELL